MLHKDLHSHTHRLLQVVNALTAFGIMTFKSKSVWCTGIYITALATYKVTQLSQFQPKPTYLCHKVTYYQCGHLSAVLMIRWQDNKTKRWRSAPYGSVLVMSYICRCDIEDVYVLLSIYTFSFSITDKRCSGKSHENHTEEVFPCEQAAT